MRPYSVAAGADKIALLNFLGKFVYGATRCNHGCYTPILGAANVVKIHGTRVKRMSTVGAGPAL